MNRGANARSAGPNRREALAALGGGLMLSVTLKGRAVADDVVKYGADGEESGWRDDPHLFLRIAPDGEITFICPRQEMGQGIRTSLAMVIADEIGADLSRVHAVQADGDQARYGNQDTDGSRSMRHFYLPMRRAGAAARTMLIAAAAERWSVPAAQIRVEQHRLVHRASGRTLNLGDVAAEAAKLAVPPRARLALRPASELRYIGKDVVSGVDLHDITTGRAHYSLDTVLPGMVFAVVARPPVVGGKLVRADTAAAEAVSGVVKIVRIEQPKPGIPLNATGGIAVVARNSWAAIKGRDRLRLTWDDGANKTYDSDRFRAELRAAVQKPGQLVHNDGDVDAAIKTAAKHVAAEYYLPHLAHAPMEPPNAVARVQGGRCEAWAGVQDPQGARQALADALGLKLADVTVHVTLLGGGFGRKSQPDFVVEAALASKAVGGAPVKLLWTREDDLGHDFYHTVSLERLDAGLDAAGRVTALRWRTAAPAINSTFGPDPLHEGSDELGMGVTDIPFAVPALRLENPAAPAHTRIGWFRSVSNIPHAFAVQSFAAELAHAAGRDHRDFLLDLIGPARRIDPRTRGDTDNYGESPELYPVDTGRLRAVIDRVSREIGWPGHGGKGRAMGLAAHHSFASYAACAMDVSVDAAGTIAVHRVDLAIDAGPIVNPERVRAQAEGSVIMGLSLALTGAITFKDGRAQQRNFDGYTVMRMDEIPNAIHVHIMPAGVDVPMGGVGEPCLPPVAPALANALFAATGKRIRNLPVGDQLKA